MMLQFGKLVFHSILLAAVVRNVESTAVTVGDDLCPVIKDTKCPDNGNLIFILFTRSNPTVGQTLDVVADNIRASYFNAANPTKIIIHGFTDSFASPHYVNMRAEYFKKGEYNVIMVDWSILARGPYSCLPSAVVNSHHVGECTAGLIQLLRQNHQMADVHVIGHSLGAATIHSVAKYVDTKLQRVTGLDPANPSTTYYGKPLGVEALQRSVADFVDIIHTNSKGQQPGPFGMFSTGGHADFYVNDVTKQPGCEDSSTDVGGAMCSHLRAVLLFIESINSGTGFYGNQCKDLQELGECSTAQPRDILMGESILKTTMGVVAVPTGDQPPFALGP